MLISKRVIRIALGTIWFIAGVLQLKPQMFTKAFVEQVVLPTAQGQPAWIAQSITWAGNVIEPHIAIYNIFFAAIQLFIGLGLIFNFKIKATLTVSFLWVFIVWWLSEGFGQLLTGQALLLTGAPGAVLLYGVIGWAIWPRRDEGHSDQVSARGVTIARWVLGVLMILGAVLQLQPAYLTSGGIDGAFAANWSEKLVGNQGITVSIVLASIELAIGIGILFKRQMHILIWVSIILSFIFWWVGQSFGQMFTALGTDPNAGPLYIVLALTAYPTILVRNTTSSSRLSRNSMYVGREH